MIAQCVGCSLGCSHSQLGKRADSLSDGAPGRGSWPWPREILVSATVLDLVDGSGLAFEDAGRHELKGAAARQLYRVA
jgi:class 3 adenylate cyclase